MIDRYQLKKWIIESSPPPPLLENCLTEAMLNMMVSPMTSGQNLLILSRCVLPTTENTKHLDRTQSWITTKLVTVFLQTSQCQFKDSFDMNEFPYSKTLEKVRN